MKQENIQKFEKAIEHFKHELVGLRIGRDSTSLLDSVMVDSYGQKVPISHIASINIPDSRTITIQPWDKGNMATIEKAILASNIGLNPVNDGVLVRLSIPPMTEERRKEMVKVAGHLSEQARISVRNVREEILKEMKSSEENGEMTKDDIEQEKKDLQENIDNFNSVIKEIASVKEKEILTI